MPEVPDVSAIVQQVKARIIQIEDQVREHHKLTAELDRLRDALARLEGAARSKVGGGRGGRPATRAKGAKRAGPSRRAGASSRAPRGQNKAKVLEALNAGPMTASEIAHATGIATATVSTMLTKLAKTDEVTKAERGYKLPQ